MEAFCLPARGFRHRAGQMHLRTHTQCTEVCMRTHTQSLFCDSSLREVRFSMPLNFFCNKDSRSQPVGKMRATSSALPDLGQRSLSPEALHTSHSWTVNEPGPGFHCQDQPGPLSSSRRLARRKRRCAHTRSCRLLRLARPDLHRLGPQLSYLTLRRYRPRNCLFMIPL